MFTPSRDPDMSDRSKLTTRRKADGRNVAGEWAVREGNAKNEMERAREMRLPGMEASWEEEVKEYKEREGTRRERKWEISEEGRKRTTIKLKMKEDEG